MTPTRVGAIIQARMSSSRFPGKVLRELPYGSGQSIIHHIVRQLKESKVFDQIVIATSHDKSDDELVRYCERENFDVFRGSLHDVHQRFCSVIEHFSFTHATRITADNPLIPIDVLRKICDQLLQQNLDYIKSDGLPFGCNVEAFSCKAFLKLSEMKLSADQKEHATLFFRENSKKFKTIQFQVAPDQTFMRLTIDYPQDYSLWNLIAQICGPNFLFPEVVSALLSKPWLLEINKNIPN